MSAFKLGHSCFKFIKSRSNPPAPGNSHMPSQSNKGNATHEAAPVLACPTVPSSNTNSCNAGVVSHTIDVAPLAAAPTRISDGKGLQDTATATTDNSSPVRGKAGTKATRVVPTHSDDGLGMQDTAADQPEATATVAVVRREARPKVAKLQAANTPAHMKQLESKVVKKDWQQYELLRACRVQKQNSDWYRAVYN
uniref:Uncharacterized protein n=1 Tax=Tetradesmus obliquus TaxID=3088 RepID=A0A383WPD3_TETOB|eukprot:jgi/Sobl393_1/13905/SZX79024.1